MAEATLSHRVSAAAREYTDAASDLLARVIVAGEGAAAIEALEKILDGTRTPDEAESEDPDVGRAKRMARKANRDAVADRGQAYADMVARLETGWREIG